MNYKNVEENLSDVIEEPEISPEESQEPEMPTKIIQIVLDPVTEEPKINYTSDLSLSQVLGALELSKETLIAINVHDKLHKRRMLKAYEDV